LPGPGQAIVGPGIADVRIDDILQLEGAGRSTYQVIGRLPDETGMFTHDLVLVNVQDARQLISLPGGYASDLAVEVFHEEEQEAILADLAAAFPWPVRCVTRRQTAGMYAGGLNRGSTLAAIAAIPAVLAVCLLVAVNIRKSTGRQSDLGIMKAMGWTTGDIVRLQLYRTLAVGLPSAAIGACLSYFLVYWPGTQWLGTIFLGWETMPPKLYLEPQGAVAVLLEVAGLVLVPVIGSALAPAARAATADVHELIEGAVRR
jgi:ABC-type lipoprotein release transport system permease subunit